jgi:hypothetical protein
MKGKTLVISGGTKGIGKECVYKFASNGEMVDEFEYFYLKNGLTLDDYKTMKNLQRDI